MRSISTKNTANKKIIFIYFSYKNFTLENFINKIIEILELNTTYSILIKRKNEVFVVRISRGVHGRVNAYFIKI